MGRASCYSLYVIKTGTGNPHPFHSVIQRLIPILSQDWMEDHEIILHQEVHRFPRKSFLDRVALAHVYRPPRTFLSWPRSSCLLSLVFRDEQGMKDYFDGEDNEDLLCLLELIPKGQKNTKDDLIQYSGAVGTFIELESAIIRNGVANVILKFQPVDMSIWIMAHEDKHTDRVSHLVQMSESWTPVS